MKLYDKRYIYLDADTVDNILKPLRAKWKLKRYSLVINRVVYEWLQMKKQLKNNPSAIAEDIKKLLQDK